MLFSRPLLPIPILLLLLACANNSQKQTSTIGASQIQQVQIPRVEVIELPFDIGRERKIQLAVEKGHQPWRINAEWVACSEIGGLLIRRNVKPDLDLADCLKNAKTEEEATKAIVTVQRDKIQYRVYLNRLVTSDGIWTPRKI